MNKGFSLSCSTSFLNRKIRTSLDRSLTTDMKLTFTPLVVVLVLLLWTAPVVEKSTDAGRCGGFDGGSEVVMEKER